nr:SDR family oxidoreductase [Rhodospirillales bacterium]
MSKVLVTGASGFVGSSLLGGLQGLNYELVATSRKPLHYTAGIREVLVNAIDAKTDWADALLGCDIVIHCAARVHIMNDDVSDSLSAFREVNAAGALELARQAADAGVKRFVFLSSIKVNGELTEGEPFAPEDKFIPTDPYGLSKYEAEQGLLALAKETGMEVVIIRPPLVYGPGVRANFASMMKWVNKGVPLPLGAVHNQRSLVALDNLVSFIIHCIDHPKAANKVFLISDGEDVSTTELLKKVAKAFDKRAFLLPIPVSWMTFAAKLIGNADVASRLFGSLQVDSSKARELLGWEPVITMDEQLKKTAEAYLNEKTV